MFCRRTDLAVFSLILALQVASCSTQKTCQIANADKGWTWIETAPAGVPDMQPSRFGNVVLWFENEDGSRIKSCDRPRRADGCFESGTTYEKHGGVWRRLDEIEETVCT